MLILPISRASVYASEPGQVHYSISIHPTNVKSELGPLGVLLRRITEEFLGGGVFDLKLVPKHQHTLTITTVRGGLVDLSGPLIWQEGAVCTGHRVELMASPHHPVHQHHPFLPGASAPQVFGRFSQFTLPIAHLEVGML